MSNERSYETQDLPLCQIVPPHAVRDVTRLQAVADSMAADGWRGRPLLGYEMLGGNAGLVQLLTGSHRFAAAKVAGLEAVPVLVLGLSEDEVAEIEESGIEDEQRLALLRGWDEDAAALMAEEIESRDWMARS